MSLKNVVCRSFKRNQASICVLLFVCIIFLLFQCRGKEYGSVERSKLLNWNKSVNCLNISNKRLSVVVPFRERFNQLLSFVPHMDSFLERQKICYEFFIMNQVDEYRFNRGQLINVGFVLSFNTSDYIAIHDVDLLPLNDLLSYAYPHDGVFHVSSPHLHPKYHYDKFIGGIVLLQNRDFVKVDGFSNNYWGWGLEDDEFYTRLVDAGIKIRSPIGIKTNSSNSFLHLHNDLEHKRDTAKLFNQRKATRKKDRSTGISTIDYELVKIHKLFIDNIPVKIYDISLNCNRDVTPWCIKPVSSVGKSKRPRKVQQQNPLPGESAPATAA